MVVYPKANIGVDVCGAQSQTKDGEWYSPCSSTTDAADTQQYVMLPQDYPSFNNITDGLIEPLFGKPVCPEQSGPAPTNPPAKSCSTFTVATADDYKVCWDPPVNGMVSLHLTVKTNGWVGLGIAEQTSSWMGGSDIVTVEWGQQGQPVVTDRYATGTAAPPADPCGAEEWQAENFQRSNGVVTGTLRRKVAVADTQTDRSITPGPQRVIVAYGDTLTMTYHGVKRKSVALTVVEGGAGEVLELPPSRSSNESTQPRFGMPVCSVATDDSSSTPTAVIVLAIVGAVLTVIGCGALAYLRLRKDPATFEKTSSESFDTLLCDVQTADNV
eukprot:TRINITY_DN6411_c0_g1_i1.p1 TRINITY_DN6411_c0_g1~~TRINITY_DN6411_c0_g1_i1.p1  ORF type:complete len:383 (+),score=111.93 TRINITY_DN6411_c0_g1_i1:167-1150(+)